MKQMSGGSWHADASQEGRWVPRKFSSTKPGGRVAMLRCGPPPGGWNVSDLKDGGWAQHKHVGRTVAN